MDNQKTDLTSVIGRKGLAETLVYGANLLCRSISSYLYVSFLRIRGYSVSYGTVVSLTSDFFESHLHAISVGRGTRIGKYTKLNAGFGGKIHIGKNVIIEDGVQIMAQHSISIGDDTQIAAYSFITDFNHKFDNKEETIASQGYETRPVAIEENVWIGTHGIILPGVTIGRGAVIGAGSVVTKSVKPYSVAVGNPAHINP